MSVGPVGRWSWLLLVLSALAFGAVACGGGADEAGFADEPATDAGDETADEADDADDADDAADDDAGDTAGQGVNDVWFVVGPEGEQIETQAGDTEANGLDY